VTVSGFYVVYAKGGIIFVQKSSSGKSGSVPEQSGIQRQK
jgi:hypothetical protein